MKRFVNSGLMVWALCVTAFLAMGVSVPHVFVAGTTISAQQVNDNFTALDSAVDALESPTRQGTLLLFALVNPDGSVVSSFSSTGAVPTVTHVVGPVNTTSTSPASSSVSKRIPSR
jgi:hypothetical protein